MTNFKGKYSFYSKSIGQQHVDTGYGGYFEVTESGALVFRDARGRALKAYNEWTWIEEYN